MNPKIIKILIIWSIIMIGIFYVSTRITITLSDLKVSGKVTKIEERHSFNGARGGKSKKYKVTYEYQYGGRNYEGHDLIERNPSNKKLYAVGESIAIFIMSDRPESSEIRE